MQVCADLRTSDLNMTLPATMSSGACGRYGSIGYDTIRDAILNFNVRSKADMSQLNLLHGNNN